MNRAAVVVANDRFMLNPTCMLEYTNMPALIVCEISNRLKMQDNNFNESVARSDPILDKNLLSTLVSNLSWY